MLVVAQYQHQKGISGISVYATVCLLKWAGRLRNLGCSERPHSAFPQESLEKGYCFFPACFARKSCRVRLIMHAKHTIFFLTPNTAQYFCSRMFLTRTMREYIAHTPLAHYFLQRVQRCYSILNHANCRRAEVNRQELMTAIKQFFTVALQYKKTNSTFLNRFG